MCLRNIHTRYYYIFFSRINCTTKQPHRNRIFLSFRDPFFRIYDRHWLNGQKTFAKIFCYLDSRATACTPMPSGAWPCFVIISGYEIYIIYNKAKGNHTRLKFVAELTTVVIPCNRTKGRRENAPWLRLPKCTVVTRRLAVGGFEP